MTFAYLMYTAAVPDVVATFARFGWRTTRYEETVRGKYDWLFVER